MVKPNGVNCPADAPTPDRAQLCACREDAAAELVAYQKAALRQLSDTGLELIAGLRVQVREAGGAPTATDSQAFHRLARAVRLTLAMLAQVEAPAKDGETAAPARSPIAARKAELDETLETVIREESEKPFQERHTRLMRERLTDLADREDFLNRPRGEIISQICKDLGLKIDWRDWFEGQEWALEAAEASGLDPQAPPPRPAVVNGRSPGPDRARVLLAMLARYAPPDSPFSAANQARARYEKPTPPPPDDGPAAPPPERPASTPQALPREARRQALARKLAANLAPARPGRMARFSSGP